MIEKWQGIPEYEGKYQVSNLGRLKRTQDGLILKPMKATNGYLIACLWKNNKQKKTVVHQLVARAFVPNPHNYNEVNHKDENKTNNNADNLEWCSHKYNMNYGSVKQKISEVRKGKEPWNKGKICPSITKAQLGKPHPHASTKKKTMEVK